MASRTVRKYVSVAYTTRPGAVLWQPEQTNMTWDDSASPTNKVRAPEKPQEAQAKPYLLWPMCVLHFSDYEPVPSVPCTCSQGTRSRMPC